MKAENRSGADPQEDALTTGTRVFYTKPSITDLEAGYAADAAENGWGDRCYEYIGSSNLHSAHTLVWSYAIATSSCTVQFTWV